MYVQLGWNGMEAGVRRQGSGVTEARLPGQDKDRGIRLGWNHHHHAVRQGNVAEEVECLSTIMPDFY